MEKSLSLDKKDFKILHELDYNARIPLTKLGKKVGLSPQVTQYRMQNLIKRGVIRGTMAVIDVHRLGFYTYRVYLRFQKTTEQDEKKIIDYFINHGRTLWVVSTSGRWDMEVVFLAKNPIQLNNIIRDFKREVGEWIKNYSVSPALVNYHFGRSYLVEGAERAKSPLYGLEPPKEELDALDVKILKALSMDGRESKQEIAKKLSVSFNTVKERMKNLEKRGVIQTYRIFIDLDKIGRAFYKAMITTRGLSEEIEKKMLSFCTWENSVVYLVETVGEWDLELEAEVKDEAEFRKIMSSFRNAFSDIVQDYELLHVYKEHKVNYFPMADEILEKIAGKKPLEKHPSLK